MFEHLSEELLSKNLDIHVNIFNITRGKYDNLVRSNLNLKNELNSIRKYIYNTKSLTWSSLDSIKMLELRVNLKNHNVSKFLIGKIDKFCYLIYKIINKYNSIVFLNGNYENYIVLQNKILESVNSLKVLKIKNYDMISNLEKEYNYSDLKELDLEFYYQFLTHVNTIVNSITNQNEININSKKYLSNENFVDRKKFNLLIKTLNSEFVSKKEFNLKIKKIEDRICNVEENKPAYILGTMVISLISLFVWKKMIKFKSKRRN